MGFDLGVQNATPDAKTDQNPPMEVSVRAAENLNESVEFRAGAPPAAQRSEQEIQAVGAEKDDPRGDGCLPQAREKTAVEVTEARPLVPAQRGHSCIKDEDGHQDHPQQQACRGGNQLNGPGAVICETAEIVSHIQL